MSDAPEAETWDETHLWTRPDGSIDGYRETNDDDDLGYPSSHASWEVRFANRGELERRYPHPSPWRGIGGARVEIWLDGEHWPGARREGDGHGV